MINVIEKPEVTIQNGQSSDTDNIGLTTQNKDKTNKNTPQKNIY